MCNLLLNSAFPPVRTHSRKDIQIPSPALLVVSLAWNTTVQHILATTSENGRCILWDLKNNRIWATLSAPRNTSLSSCAWNPGEGFEIATAVNDDDKPVLQLWDLRKSRRLPVATLSGHTKGILSISWNVQGWFSAFPIQCLWQL